MAEEAIKVENKPESKFKTFIKNINGKMVVKVGAFVFGFALVVITALVDAGLDPDKLNVYVWLTNALISTGIVVYGLFLGESIGSDVQTKIKNGLYQISLKAYNTLKKELEPIIIYFAQFFYDHCHKELRKTKIDYLQDAGIDYEFCELILDNVNKGNIYKLSQEEGLLLKNGDVIPELNEFQIEAIQDILDGKIKLRPEKPTYYTTAFANVGIKSDVNIPRQIATKIKLNKHGNRILKIATGLFVSLVWAMVTVNEFMGGSDPVAQNQAWMNLISRIATLFTSFAAGWASAVIDTKLQAEKLEDKYNMLNQFKAAYNLKEFVPLSRKEEAKKKYEEVMKKREEELQNVVTPEVVEPVQIEDKTIYVEPIKEVK